VPAEANIRVAMRTAEGDHFSGCVNKRISSQFVNAGIILNAFGTFPDVYFSIIFPTLNPIQVREEYNVMRLIKLKKKSEIENEVIYKTKRK
jgi:hypothetical protein